jgi:hypothetical protein
MINSTADYKAAITGDVRRMYVQATVNIVDPDITFGAPTGSAQAVYSQPAQIHDYDFDAADKYATLELNRWQLDGTYEPVPTIIENQVGYITAAISDADGIFSASQIITQPFSNVDILQAITLQFSTMAADGVPADFTVEVLKGAVSAQSWSYTDNKAARISISEFAVNNPTAIRLTITKTSLPYRRVRVIEMLPGIHENWGIDDISAISITQQANFTSLALPYGTCALAVDNHDRRFEPTNKNGVFRSIEERQGIDIKIGALLPSGIVEYKGVGRFYQYSGGWKTGNNGMTIQWDLVDIIGLIADRQYIPPTTLPTNAEGWISSIVGQLGANFANFYIIEPSLASVSVAPDNRENVTGKTCGEILRNVCMAIGAWAHADAQTGKLAVKLLPTTGGYLTLDNMETYPTVRANEDIAALIFKLHDGSDTELIIPGNEPTSNNTVSIDNPFIKTAAQANAAAAVILKSYGGNMYETIGRGDPASELGDVDMVQINKTTTVTARRISQTFAFNGGVLRGCESNFVEVNE